MKQRIHRGTAATLTLYLTDSDGAAVDAGGTMTVGVALADGTSVIAPGSATVHAALGKYTVTLPAAQTVSLNVLTASWVDSASPTVTRQSEHEIVGGYLFTLAEVRAFETLNDVTMYSDALVIARRSEVEDELERLRAAAFVPRFARVTLHGDTDREIVTGRTWLRRLVSARIYSSPTVFTALTSTELAACVVTEDGRVRRTDGNYWPDGFGNVVLEIEHGYTAWGEDLRNAALKRLRHILQRRTTAIPDQATSYPAYNGAQIPLAQAGEQTTGIAEVDAVYSRYPIASADGGEQWASRTLQYDPQVGGMFRGGIK